MGENERKSADVADRQFSVQIVEQDDCEHDQENDENEERSGIRLRWSSVPLLYVPSAAKAGQPPIHIHRVDLCTTHIVHSQHMWAGHGNKPANLEVRAYFTMCDLVNWTKKHMPIQRAVYNIFPVPKSLCQLRG